MRKLYAIPLYVILFAFITSCAELINIAKLPTATGSAPLSGNEIIEGLKTALLVGTDTSVSVTSRINGFYRDEAIKILLPPEAQKIYANRNNALLRMAGLDKKLEDAVLAINRAAEDAASEAGPIFKNAIKGLTISDGYSILRGTNPAAQTSAGTFDSTAATGYLRSTTYLQLENAFSPKINASLNKTLVGNYSPNQIWNTLTGTYNAIANKSIGIIEPVATTDLGKYVTQKALDGIFFKVAIEEKEIRNNPAKWAATAVGNILQRVFGKK